MADLSLIDKRINETLQRELKGNYKRYMKLLQQWFQHQLSKEDFDQQAKSLFPNGDVKTHNRFVISIMSSCLTVDASMTAKQSRVAKNLRHRFKEIPQMPLIQLISDYQIAHAKQSAFDHGRKDFSVVTTSCIREQRLPGSWMLYGRLMNTLQLYSLQEFSPEALNCLAEATQSLVRRLLLSALASRRCCRIVTSGAGDRTEADSATVDSRAPTAELHPRRLERTAFGRVPIVRFSMGEGYVAAVNGERLNAHLHASAAAAASAATAEDSLEATERLRVDALLRCETSAVSRAAGGAAMATVLGLDDLYRALTQPDSHVVGYHCLQRRDQPVTSHFVRFLSQSRALHRLRQRQLRDLLLSDADCPPGHRRVADGLGGDVSRASALPAAVAVSLGPLPPHSLPTTNGPPAVMTMLPPSHTVIPLSSSYHLERLLLDCTDDPDHLLTDFV